MASRSGAAPVPVEPGIRLHVVEVSLAKILAKYPKANTYVRASVCKKSADGKLVEVPQTAQRTEPRPSTDPAVDQWLTIPGPLTATNVLLVEVKTRDWAWLTKARVAMCTLDSDALALGSTEPGLDSWFPLYKGKHSPTSCGSIHLCLESDTETGPPEEPPPPVATAQRPDVEYVFPNGDRYTGAWQGDHMHGAGVLHKPDGECYAGEWVQGVRQGQGVQTWPYDAWYKGNFLADVRHGHGVYGFKRDYVYTGEWKEGKQHGMGRLSLPGGGYYSGWWRRGKKEGFGEALSQGAHYCGHYCNNHKHGLGLLAEDGTWYETRHANGLLLEYAEISEHTFNGILQNLRAHRPYHSELLDGEHTPLEKVQSSSSDIIYGEGGGRDSLSVGGRDSIAGSERDCMSSREVLLGSPSHSLGGRDSLSSIDVTLGSPSHSLGGRNSLVGRDSLGGTDGVELPATRADQDSQGT